MCKDSKLHKSSRGLYLIFGMYRLFSLSILVCCMAHHEHRNRVPEEHAPRPTVLLENLPQELFSYPQWICWRYVERGGGKKPDKQPVNPHTLGNAGVHWANTWSSVEHAYGVYQDNSLAGIGFVLTRDDPFVGVDVDHCVEDDQCLPYAQEIVQCLQSYTEYSPSGTGLRILITSPGYAENHRTRALELYSHSRFLTLTGNHVDGTPPTIAAVSRDQISTLVPGSVPDGALYQAQIRSRGQASKVRSDIELWEQIFSHDRFGGTHRERFLGDTSPDGRDHSLTVLRLLNTLARWTDGDPVKMRSMMLLSPLANEKWFSKRGKQDWLDYQIANAIAYVSKAGKR